MTPKKSEKISQDELFRARLDNIIDLNHELVRASKIIDWKSLEQYFGKDYCQNNGRPAINTRLMVGLQMLKALYNLGDEEVLQMWLQNPYWQYFCGMQYFEHKMPIDNSSMTRWRNRFKEDGINQINKNLFKAMLKKEIIKKSDLKKATLDTTVQTKAIRYPTDISLCDRQREHLVKQAKKEGIELRQNYNKVSKKACRKYANYAHAKQFKRAKSVIKKVKNYLGRVYRDIVRSSVEVSPKMRAMLEQTARLLSQEKTSKNKIYSIHAPEVECISKGKTHKKYEFGVKASFATTTKNNWIIGGLSIAGNPYDGHTIESTLERVKETVGVYPQEIVCDLGYRRKEEIEIPTKVHIVKRSRKGLSRAMKEFYNRRSAIEPIIGHMKSEHSLERNRLKGEQGDRINVVMSMFGYNFKKLLKLLRESKSLFAKFLLSILQRFFANNLNFAKI